jgi:hypothetical protein
MKYFMICVALLAFVSFESPEASARGGLLSRLRAKSQQSVVQRSSKSTKLHETNSRSAVLDRFFGSGAGHDRSWYVGR